MKNNKEKTEKIQNVLLLVRRNEKIHSLLLENGRLVKITTNSESKLAVGTVCIAKVTDIVSNIDAAFVRLSENEKGYISTKELSRALVIGAKKGKACEQDSVLVQIVKMPSKGKEATVTGKISLSGKYCVVSEGKGGLSFSLKLSQDIKNKVSSFLDETFREQIAAYSVIIRTNVMEITDYSVLKEEILFLCKEWNKIYETAKHRTDYSILWEIPPAYLNELRNLPSNSYSKIVTQEQDIYAKTYDFLKQYQPMDLEKLSFYEDTKVPLNVCYSLKSQMEEAISKKVWLSCGGFLYIEPTEALTVIDVNTGKYSQKSAKEDTFYKINLEAASEIARQIRLRNLSGIIIIDFINMESTKNKECLLNFMEKKLMTDPVSTKVIDITKLGLVEITRKKADKTIYEQIFG